jgi:selenocysteine lyase/cysteine desulfurase
MTYSTQAASVITDVRSIRAVVGRIHSHTAWTIIDCSSAISHAAFVVDDDDDSDDDDSSLV